MLLSGYRLAFHKSRTCNLTEEKGRKLFETDPYDVKKVPDDCVRYVEGNGEDILHISEKIQKIFH